MAARSLLLELKACLLTSIQTSADLTNMKSYIPKNLKILKQLADHVTLTLGVFMVVLVLGCVCVVVASDFHRDQRAEKKARHLLIHEEGTD